MSPAAVSRGPGVGQADAAGGIVAAGIEKRFGTVQALSGVDLTVPPGTVLALLGPNGAGKSTLIRILAASVLPDAGTVSIGGIDAVERPRLACGRLGLVLAEERSFFWRLTGIQNLTFFAALHGLRRREAVERSREVLERVGIAPLATRRVDRYSTGMKAKLSIARALLGDPAVLLLDEPTRSLDPIATVDTRTLVLELAHAQGLAVLFATHDLHEATAVADHVAVLVDGKIAASLAGGGSAADLEALLLEATGHAGVLREIAQAGGGSGLFGDASGVPDGSGAGGTGGMSPPPGALPPTGLGGGLGLP